MTTEEIKEIFKKTYGDSHNFMTPDVVRYGKRGRLVYELSKGEGFNRESIYGVTVLSLDGEKQPTLSKGGFNLAQAERHIKSL